MKELELSGLLTSQDMADLDAMSLEEVLAGIHATGGRHGTGRSTGKSSTYTGVSWDAERSQWRAQLQRTGKPTKNKFFSSQVEAALQFDAWRMDCGM